jgi:hypothetical protein
MALDARHRHLDPAQALAMGDDADVLALGLQYRALLDVQFEQRLDRRSWRAARVTASTYTSRVPARP